MRARAFGGHWQPKRPTLEQIAYRFWGARLEAACPNGSLRFRRTLPAFGEDVSDAQGGSWGDCHPYVKRSGRLWPEVCATAMHEAGHERGLLDVPGAGGIMDNTRMIIGQHIIMHYHGRRYLRQVWTGIPAVCQPGHYR